MTRVRVLVEGQTEESFVTRLLAPALYLRGVYLYPILFRRGGGSFRYMRAGKIILNSLKEDRGVYCTTLVDFYGMPPDWPGRSEAGRRSGTQAKAEAVEQALAAEIGGRMGEGFDPARFIPYVQMHEFEALMFSDPLAFAESLGRTDVGDRMGVIRSEFNSPEDINDNYETAPSRRILAVYPGYAKVIDGVPASERIGLRSIRAACPRFDTWVDSLERLRE